MNDMAEKLGLTSTYFDSPHGLMNIQNFSTAHDMSKLSAICMKNEAFRKIVSTKIYECVGRSKHHLEDEPRDERKRKIKQREQGEIFFQEENETPTK
jgi:D-alanyl-D-alanine carboxypeptidase